MKPPRAQDLLAMVWALGTEQAKHPTGSGWETVEQMAKKKGVSKSSIRYRMAKAIERGLKVERFVGSAPSATGQLVKQTWFRVKL